MKQLSEKFGHLTFLGARHDPPSRHPRMRDGRVPLDGAGERPLVSAVPGGEGGAGDDTEAGSGDG